MDSVPVRFNQRIYFMSAIIKGGEPFGYLPLLSLKKKATH